MRCGLSRPEVERARTLTTEENAGAVAWAMPESWHSCGMARTRVSTTVDETLLTTARRMRRGVNDAVLFDEALAALVRRHRSAEIDASYAAYDRVPIDEPDEWGDLASFREAASRRGRRGA
jgi:hypothetical protein